MGRVLKLWDQMKKLHGSIGVTRPKPWNGPQIVGPNEKPTWFHRAFSISLSFFNN
jgi:hypothetical protein